MKLYLVLIILLLVVSTKIVYSLSQSIKLCEIALNHETKQCGLFCDENTSQLNEGWKLYQFNVDIINGSLKTEYGNCNFSHYVNFTETLEKCCNQLGYVYIPGDISKVQTTEDISENLTSNQTCIMGSNCEAPYTSYPDKGVIVNYFTSDVIMIGVMITIVVLLIYFIIKGKFNTNK